MNEVETAKERMEKAIFNLNILHQKFDKAYIELNKGFLEKDIAIYEYNLILNQNLKQVRK